MGKKLFAFIIAAILLFTSMPKIAYARLNAYEWKLMEKLTEAEAKGDTEATIPILLELISIEEQYDDQDSHLRLAPYYQKLGRYYDSVGEYEKARDCFFKEAFHRKATGNYESATADLARSRQLNIEVEIFREVPVENGQAQPGYNLAKNEPPYGAYLGGHFHLDPNVGIDYGRAAFAYGRPHAVLEYVEWGNPVPNATLDKVRQLGVPLQLALQPVPNLTVVKDEYYIRGLLAQLRSLGVPVLLRFAGEMNGEWVSWGTQPEFFKEKFRLVADLAHKDAPNVAMVWCPNHTPEDYEKYYPGDEYVDWVGVNFYSDYYMSGDKNIPLTSQTTFQAGKTSSPIDKLVKIYDLYSERKPIMIGECGASHYSVTTKEDCLDWGLSQLSQIYGYFPLKFPRIKAVFYFSVNQASPDYLPSNRWSNYTLAREDYQKRYVELTKSPWYLTGKDSSSPVRYAPINEVGLDSGSNKILAYVRLPYPFVGKVQYELDGKVVGSSSKIPFEVEVKIPGPDHAAGAVGSGTAEPGTPEPGITESTISKPHVLTIRTWYAGGKEGPSRSYAIDGETLRAVPLSGQELSVPQFKDMNGHWANEDVKRLASLGVLKGYEDGTFRPDATIARAEFLKVLFGAAGINSEPTETGPNSDQEFPYGRGHWAGSIIDAGEKLRLIRDDSGQDIAGNFNPDAPCPRWEMAVYAVRAISLQKGVPGSGKTLGDLGGHITESSSTGFSDEDQILARWRETIRLSSEMGLIKGLGDGRFGPNESMTRAQACVMALRIMRYLSK